MSGRYGHNSNTQPYGTSAINPPNNWGHSDNRFNSFNLNHNWVLSGQLNEFIFQYADFRNQITPASSAPNEVFPNGVTLGANSNTPQTTEQHKFQFRDDFSWHVYRGGLGHDFKAGVNFINEPHLFTTFNGGRRVVVYTHATNDLDGPISSVSFSDGDAAANLPMKQLGCTSRTTGASTAG